MKKSRKGIALVIFLIVILILFLLFGALTYRVQTTLFVSRNNYIETQAEATAKAAARHAISTIFIVGLGSFPNNIIIQPPGDIRTANEPYSIPQQTYDLGVFPPQNATILRNNINLRDLTNNQLNRDFSYRLCVWQYDPTSNPNSIRVKIFIFFRNRLIKSYIFTVEQ